MAYTQEQLEAVEEAIASGTLRVRYSDGELWFNSLEELRSLRAAMRHELEAEAGTRRTHRLAVISKGL